MDVSQYREIFIAESQEHLQALNKALLELEKDPQNVELLGQIFRSAHTLKGMAGTMKFNQIAELSHEMENVLDRLRTGEGVATSETIDVLLECLDSLERLVDDIVADKKSEVDLTPLLDKLKMLSSAPAGRVSKAKKKKKKKEMEETGDEVTIGGQLEDFEQRVLADAVQKGYEGLKITVTLDKECVMKSARAFMVFKALEQCGEVIKSIPPVEEIEDEKFDYQFEVFLVTKEDRDSVITELESISEVEKIDISPLTLEEAKPKKTAEMATAPKAAEVIQSIAESKITAAKTQSVRVNIEHLDTLMNLVGELAINRSRLVQIARTNNIPELSSSIDQLERISADLQYEVMQIRMVPVDHVFNRFPRMVRDLAKERGKEIDLSVEGKEIELDRTVLDEIGDPLVHLLRNALDHGIETAEEREKMGKPLAGKVELIARREGEHVIIEVTDDGKGIDPEVIRGAAVEKGLITSEEASKLDDHESIMLICLPGFSTAKVVTNISGRGVGMDVVRNKVESLGGTLEIKSDLGAGSSSVLRLPPTLAIIQTLMVKLQDETYAIPLSNVVEIVETTPDNIKSIAKKEVILLRGSVVPLVRLNKLVGTTSGENIPNKSITVVIVEIGGRKTGLVVDSIIGQQELVIKSLGKLAKAGKGFGGASILGDGTVALILDVLSLV